MKATILLLIIFSSLISGCRTKNKITAAYKENKKEKEKVNVDSLRIENSKSIQKTSVEALIEEKQNETSGEILIKGISDLSNPFVFHQVVGNDTLQSISITGNAEYLVNNHYTKTDNKKLETKRDEVVNIFQGLAQSNVSQEKIKEVDSAFSEESKNIQSNGFQAATWIVVTIVVTFLIFIFFFYKYFKK